LKPPERMPETAAATTQPEPHDHAILGEPLSHLVGVHVPTWRLVLTLAWPVLLQQLLVLTVQLSDRLLAGRFQHVGDEANIASQNAQTTGSYFAWVITNYTIFVSVGSTALVARFVGAGDHKEANAVTHQALVIAAALGILASAVALPLLPTFMALLQLPPDAAGFAVDYLRPLFWLLPFQMIETAGIACLAGAGDTRTGLWVLGGVAVINLPLAWLFFHGAGPLPALGFAGIAVGTAVSHLLGAVLVLVVLWRGRAGLRLRARLFGPRWDLWHRLLRVSAPAAADALSVAAGQLWFLSIVNPLGTAAGAAHGIAIQWEALGYLSGSAFGTAAMTLVGQNLGARRPDAAARSGWTAFVLGLATMSFMGAVFFILAEPMFALFNPRAGQRAVIDAGVPVLRLVAFAMPPLASCIVLTAALRGAGDTRVPVLFTWLGFFVVRIPLAYLLTRPEYGLGLLGAWLAMLADIVVRGAFVLWRFAGGRWRTIRI
jgi:putative MATE family efflux protein